MVLGPKDYQNKDTEPSPVPEHQYPNFVLILTLDLINFWYYNLYDKCCRFVSNGLDAVDVTSHLGVI